MLIASPVAAVGTGARWQGAAYVPNAGSNVAAISLANGGYPSWSIAKPPMTEAAPVLSEHIRRMLVAGPVATDCTCVRYHGAAYSAG